MELLPSSVANLPAFADFETFSFGSLLLPGHPIRFGFQVDLIPTTCPPQLLFGLLSRDTVNGSSRKLSGFTVKLDLEMREVWDYINGSGLVGWIEHPQGLAGFTDEEPLLLGWEIEWHGKALIPKLIVGQQQWLYPAIQCTQPVVMESLVGWAGAEGSNARDIFLHPALWREHVAVHSAADSSTLATA